MEAAECVDWRNYPIWFVHNISGDIKDATENLKLTFDYLLVSGLQPTWVSVEECLKITRKEPKLFIMASFSGPAFEHLLSIKCRIMGPLCILTCLSNGEPFPRRAHPVYSMAMKNINVSCTKMAPSARSEICRKVRLMCGAYSADLTKEVTHLVCGEVGSKKYHVAASFGLAIVNPEWVDEAWNHSQYKKLHASALPYNNFRCLIFQGLTITVSQLSNEEREYIKEVVEEEGGFYSPSLNVDKSTHLIALEPKGEKYKYAKEWKLFCINDNWFYDSLEAGYCMDENLYPVREKKEGMGSNLVKTQCINERVCVEETMKANNSKTNSLVSKKSPFKRTIPSLEMLDSFDISTLPKSEDFLDGCKIFLSDFSDKHMQKLCKIINAGCGMRFSKFSDSISHVVCGRKNNKLIESIRESSARPHVVSFDWLVQCCKEETLLDEAPFSCMEIIPFSPHDEKSSPSVENIALYKRKQRQLQADTLRAETLPDFRNIMKEYVM